MIQLDEVSLYVFMVYVRQLGRQCLCHWPFVGSRTVCLPPSRL